jgi:hypothetical protein
MTNITFADFDGTGKTLGFQIRFLDGPCPPGYYYIDIGFHYSPDYIRLDRWGGPFYSIGDAREHAIYQARGIDADSLLIPTTTPNEEQDQ